MKKQVLRVIDANYNRAKEGIRVSEEVARFVLGLGRLAGRFKKTRHALTQAILSFPVSYRAIVAERSVRHDVGRASFVGDKKKIRIEDIFSSNMQRSEEAVRVLEEWSKMISISASKKFQKIRFALYELEKETLKKF
ncbi:MAG: thiamine-phosphate pyrophosphorylase [Candidatus Omnitrophica bacterium]|nr:thiamine-phosphate pyrophosphorylase [Candidatus Omnitrophota bacterium]